MMSLLGGCELVRAAKRHHYGRIMLIPGHR
jgi:hypothetical protein